MEQETPGVKLLEPIDFESCLLYDEYIGNDSASLGSERTVNNNEH